LVIATPLLNAARKLIDTFGNSATLYTFSGATKTSSDEGEYTVSNWGTGSTIKIVDGGSQGSEQVVTQGGFELVGEDEKIIRDSVTITINDRVTYASKEYRVTSLREERVESTTIIKIARFSEVTATTTW
jgi:hypothetical protein